MENDGLSAAAIAEAAAVDLPLMARETFGSDEKAQRWLRRPTQALSGASPLDVASSGAIGTQKVVDLLKRIDHGLSV